jgi:hypothetical protein
MATFCSRHAFPFVALNLFSGEKYGYADQIIIKLQEWFGKNRKMMIFYDVACIYKSHALVSIESLTFRNILILTQKISSF